MDEDYTPDLVRVKLRLASMDQDELRVLIDKMDKLSKMIEEELISRRWK